MRLTLEFSTQNIFGHTGLLAYPIQTSGRIELKRFITITNSLKTLETIQILTICFPFVCLSTLKLDYCYLTYTYYASLFNFTMSNCRFDTIYEAKAKWVLRIHKQGIRELLRKLLFKTYILALNLTWKTVTSNCFYN